METALKKIESGTTRIGFMGLGVMGGSMAGHLKEAGYDLIVHSRTKGKASALIASGAQWADSPRIVGQQSDVVISIVGFPRDVRQILLGDQGAIAAARQGTVFVDMTTSAPSLATEIHEETDAHNMHSLDAPVSGGDIGAREAKLSIMVGGKKEVFEAVKPLFEIMGTTIVHQGPAGAGQHTKMANQIAIATNMIGVCESLLYAHKAGLDLPTVMQSIGGGAASSFSLNKLGLRMINNDFDPGFFVEHFIKDMGIALDECHRMGLSLPGLALAKQLYEGLKAQGHGRDGTQSLIDALGNLSGIDWKNR